MTDKEFKALKEGDIITSLGSGNGYIIARKLDKESFLAIRTIVVSNPSEWKKVKKSE